MASLSRWWHGASLQAKYLWITVPAALLLTVGGNAFRQALAGERAIAQAEQQFDEVGRRTAQAMSDEIWNYNVVQAGAIVQSLMLIPNVVRVTSVEMAKGREVTGSPFAFQVEDSGLAHADAAHQRTAQFPIRVERPQQAPETVGRLTITYSMASVLNENRWLMRASMISGTLGALLVIGGVTYALMRTVLRPIDQIAASTRQPDEGFVPVQLSTGDQIGQLVRAYNDLRLRQIDQHRQLQSVRDEAVAANSAKSAFLAMMSHELRTPLNAVIGYSEMLKDELAEDGITPTTMDDLDKIRSAGKHLLELISSVLDLSKIEAGRIELEIAPLDVQQLVDYAASTVHPLLEGKGNRLELCVPADIGQVQSDATRLRQVLLNLLSNAAKFTSQGVITLTARREQLPGRGERLLFDVQDTGIGMTPEQQGRLFQAFVQADSSTPREYGGTGLGLVISRRLCQLLGGDVTVRSAPGQGSCFTASVACDGVPSVGSAGSTAAAPPASAHAATGGGHAQNPAG